jgi:hypothetical protein
LSLGATRGHEGQQKQRHAGDNENSAESAARAEAPDLMGDDQEVEGGEAGIGGVQNGEPAGRVLHLTDGRENPDDRQTLADAANGPEGG